MFWIVCLLLVISIVFLSSVFVTFQALLFNQRKKEKTNVKPPRNSTKKRQRNLLWMQCLDLWCVSTYPNRNYQHQRKREKIREHSILVSCDCRLVSIVTVAINFCFCWKKTHRRRQQAFLFGLDLIWQPKKRTLNFEIKSLFIPLVILKGFLSYLFSSWWKPKASIQSSSEIF